MRPCCARVPSGRAPRSTWSRSTAFSTRRQSGMSSARPQRASGSTRCRSHTTRCRPSTSACRASACRTMCRCSNTTTTGESGTSSAIRCHCSSRHATRVIRTPSRFCPSPCSSRRRTRSPCASNRSTISTSSRCARSARQPGHGESKTCSLPASRTAPSLKTMTLCLPSWRRSCTSTGMILRTSTRRWTPSASTRSMISPTPSI